MNLTDARLVGQLTNIANNFAKQSDGIYGNLVVTSGIRDAKRTAELIVASFRSDKSEGVGKNVPSLNSYERSRPRVVARLRGTLGPLAALEEPEFEKAMETAEAKITQIISEEEAAGQTFSDHMNRECFDVGVWNLPTYKAKLDLINAALDQGAEMVIIEGPRSIQSQAKELIYGSRDPKRVRFRYTRQGQHIHVDIGPSAFGDFPRQNPISFKSNFFPIPFNGTHFRATSLGNHKWTVEKGASHYVLVDFAKIGQIEYEAPLTCVEPWNMRGSTNRLCCDDEGDRSFQITIPDVTNANLVEYTKYSMRYCEGDASPPERGGWEDLAPIAHVSD